MNTTKQIIAELEQAMEAGKLNGYKGRDLVTFVSGYLQNKNKELGDVLYKMVSNQ